VRCGISLLRSVCYDVPARTGYMLKCDMLEQAKQYVWKLLTYAICSSNPQLSV